MNKFTLHEHYFSTYTTDALVRRSTSFLRRSIAVDFSSSEIHDLEMWITNGRKNHVAIGKQGTESSFNTFQ